MDFRPTPAQQPEPVAASATPAPHGASSKQKRAMLKQRQMLVWLIVALALIAAVLTALYYVHRYNDSQKQVEKLASNPTITAQQQQQDLIAKVGKLTVLPKNETPTVATVTDISKLKDQAFFANAQNGDKVLIYTQAKQAYLYRPSTNKLVNIAPVNIGNNQSSSTTGTTTQSQTSTKTPTTPKKQ